MISMEESSKKRPIFSSHEELFDEEYYDGQLPEKKRRLTPLEDIEDDEKTEREREPLDLSDKRWRKAYGDARRQMGDIEPGEYLHLACPSCGEVAEADGRPRALVHAKGQKMVDHILRVFDL